MWACHAFTEFAQSSFWIFYDAIPEKGALSAIQDEVGAMVRRWLQERTVAKRTSAERRKMHESLVHPGRIGPNGGAGFRIQRVASTCNNGHIAPISYPQRRNRFEIRDDKKQSDSTMSFFEKDSSVALFSTLSAPEPTRLAKRLKISIGQLLPNEKGTNLAVCVGMSVTIDFAILVALSVIVRKEFAANIAKAFVTNLVSNYGIGIVTRDSKQCLTQAAKYDPTRDDFDVLHPKAGAHVRFSNSEDCTTRFREKQEISSDGIRWRCPSFSGTKVAVNISGAFVANFVPNYGMEILTGDKKQHQTQAVEYDPTAIRLLFLYKK